MSTDTEAATADSVSFDRLADLLLVQGAQLSPAALHGGLCGLLCGGFPADDSHADPLSALAAALDTPLAGELAEHCEALYQQARRQLGDMDFGFHPLLPDDDLELSQRVVALAQWCGAFLAGYAQARASARGGGSSVAPDTAEALRDFAAIAQAAGDDGDEDGEREFVELVEYLRVAVMTVSADSRAPVPASDPEQRH